MTGKQALIIGASRGLGAGLVQALAERGWNVTATTRRSGASVTGAARSETVDIDDASSISALRDRLSNEKFDLIFVVAGVSGANPATPIHQEKLEEAQRIYRTNAISPICFAESFIESLTKDGQFAFMSSTLGSVSQNTDGGFDSYRASKAALNTLARSFAARHPGRGILIAHPGWVRTDMGGPNAPLDVATSTAGLATMVEKRAGERKAVFVDWENKEISW